jgi:hypothetical protein
LAGEDGATFSFSLLFFQFKYFLTAMIITRLRAAQLDKAWLTCVDFSTLFLFLFYVFLGL